MWEDLSRLTERRISETKNEDLEARIWWINSQIGGGSMPISLLEGSVDSVTEAVSASEDGTELREKLKQLSIILLKTVSAKISTTSPHYQIFVDRLSSFGVNASEVNASPVNASPVNASVVKNNVVEKGTKQDPVLSSPLESLVGTPSTSGESKASFTSSPSVSSELDFTSRTVRKNHDTRNRLLLIVGLVLFVSLIVFSNLYWKEWLGNEQSIQSPETELAQSQIVSAAPELPALSPSDNFSQLDAVFYGLGDNPERTDPSQTARPQQHLNQQTQQREIPLHEDVPTQESPREKIQIDTSGPIEDRRPRASNRQPLIPPGPDSSNDSSRGSASTNDGGQNRKMGGQKNDRFATVIQSTDVRRGPNFRSPVVSQLNKGDEVEVDDNLGDWVQIRSREGRIGFVLSSDLGLSPWQRDAR